MQPALLVRTEREGFIEKLHYGFVLVIDEGFNIVYKQGEDKNTPFPFRSGAKPLQATAVIDSGAFGHFGLGHEELAVICASHTGTKEHIEKVRGILKKTGLREKNLKCPINHNCSGKHAGMLSVCVKNNWNPDTYTDINHPLQEQIVMKTRELCMLGSIPPIVKDGCSAPVTVMPLYNMGIAYLNLFSSYRDIKLAMSRNPFLIGGDKRTDTEVIQASGGNLIAKVAAGGMCMVINLKEKKVLIVRITDGDYEARSDAVRDMLKKLGWVI